MSRDQFLLLRRRNGAIGGLSSRHRFRTAERMRDSAYRRLEVWQHAMVLVEHCDAATGAYDPSERYGLTSQTRRAAISIPANIAAEGYCRRSRGAYANHVAIALGSHGELETCLELALRLRMLPAASHEGLEAETRTLGRMLTRLWQSLTTSP